MKSYMRPYYKKQNKYAFTPKKNRLIKRLFWRRLKRKKKKTIRDYIPRNYCAK